MLDRLKEELNEKRQKYNSEADKINEKEKQIEREKQKFEGEKMMAKLQKDKERSEVSTDRWLINSMFMLVMIVIGYILSKLTKNEI